MAGVVNDGRSGRPGDSDRPERELRHWDGAVDDGAAERAARDNGADETGPATGDRRDFVAGDGESTTDIVDEGLALLRATAFDEGTVADVLDRIESVTGNPDTQRRILEAAVEVGLLERDGSVVRSRDGVPDRFERVVVRREGEFDCRRCGATITTGCFVREEDVEVGPYGSTCIRYLLGRE